ncbi:Gfo/Idh/MocA family oxidoreductase [Candidatus Poribacteria bacterium]|nr:Gfo/Idh/MocA family oxidoreductase [Candidatus Poribacteria bacterium]
MPNKLRFAVIGSGGFAETCHIPGLQRHPNAEVVALCRRNRDLCAQMAQKFNVPKIYTDATALIADAEIDGVTIATPNVFHHPIAVQALKAGKHVFCEKPLAMNASEAREMYDVAEASGEIHHVAFTLRYTHCLYQMRDMLRQGQIGVPFFVRIQADGWGGLRTAAKAAWRNQSSLSGTGILGDMGSHFFDLIRWLCGEIRQVGGILRNIPRVRPHASTGEPTAIDTDDLAACWFETESGLQGQFFVSWVTPSHGENSYIEVLGEEGTLFAYLSRGNQDVLRIRHRDGDWQPVDLPPEAAQGKPHALERMMGSFVDGIRKGQLDAERDASFFDGWKAQAAIDAVVESVKQKRWMEV